VTELLVSVLELSVCRNYQCVGIVSVSEFIILHMSLLG
jgi:hypothetical protein